MSIRIRRLSDHIRDVLAGHFQGDFIRDPRIQEVTITAVRMTKDLQTAYVYFRLYHSDQEAVTKAIEGLSHASGLLRRALAETLEVRRIPRLKFFYDKTIENAEKIEKLIARLN